MKKEKKMKIKENLVVQHMRVFSSNVQESTQSDRN